VEKQHKHGNEFANVDVGGRALANLIRAGLVGIAVLLLGSAAQGDPIPFYKGKTLHIVVGFTAGGGYDLYARVLARHIGRHLPGQPAVIVENMPGAGSVKAANYLFNVAPRDGTVVGTFDRGLPMERLLGRTEGQQFDATKFTWIGSVTDEPAVCAFSARSGIRSWADMKAKPFKVGGAGATADDEIYPAVLKAMFHLPLRIVSGYPGRPETVLSIQRGEIDGLCGWSWSSLMSRDKALLDTKQVVVALQLGVDNSLDLPGVPLVGDLATNPEDKAALRLIFSRLTMARPFAAPPGLSSERMRDLREAFDATMQDPDFLAEAERLMLEVRPQSGAKVSALIGEIYAYPADVVRRAGEAIRP
jgi:tripartite-type tricarboxylate transporter receptor subunit TctC